MAEVKRYFLWCRSCGKVTEHSRETGGFKEGVDYVCLVCQPGGAFGFLTMPVWDIAEETRRWLERAACGDAPRP